jgi:hypothetical protein
MTLVIIFLIKKPFSFFFNLRLEEINKCLNKLNKKKRKKIQILFSKFRIVKNNATL